MEFLSLGKDLVVHIIQNYIDPVTAVKCLRLCKRVYGLFNNNRKHLLITRVLKHNMERDYQRQMDKLILCPVCKCKMESKKALDNHVRKHKNANRNIPVHKPLILSKCSDCGTTTSNFTSHYCYIRQTRHCHGISGSYYFKWLDVLREDREWYKDDPNFTEHKCECICKFCKKRMGCCEGFSNHFEKCEQKSEIIRVYVLKGDRSEEEWSVLMESYNKKDEAYLLSQKVEEEFEKEYIFWKSFR